MQTNYVFLSMYEKVWRKLSATALSRQFPFRLMLHRISLVFNNAWNSLLTCCTPLLKSWINVDPIHPFLKSLLKHHLTFLSQLLNGQTLYYTFEYFLLFLLIRTPTKGIINNAFFVSTFSGQDQFQFFTLSYTDWASFPYKTSLKKTIFINIFGPLLQRKIIVNLKNKNLTIEN